MRFFWLVPILQPAEEDMFVAANDPKEAMDFYLKRCVSTGKKASPIVGFNELPVRLGVVTPNRIGARLLPVAEPVSTALTFLGARRSDAGFWICDEPLFTSEGMSDSEFLQKVFHFQFNEKLHL